MIALVIILVFGACAIAPLVASDMPEDVVAKG